MNQNRCYGMPHCRDRIYGAAAVLSYWVFKCRDRKRSPSMGTKTWTYLESSIKNSAEISNTLEKFLSTLCDKLISFLRPSELNLVISPKQRILRVNEDATEIQELDADKSAVFFGWLDIIEDIKLDNATEWDVLDLLRNQPGIIQVICRLRYEEDKLLGQDEPLEVIDVTDFTNIKEPA